MELEYIPAIVREKLTDEEALLIVTETNLLQRSFADMTHSERAVTLSMHHEAIKRQGRRTDLIREIENMVNAGNISDSKTFVPLEQKLYARDKTACDYGLDSSTVARYLRINKLIDPLKERLDNDFVGKGRATERTNFRHQAEVSLAKSARTQKLAYLKALSDNAAKRVQQSKADWREFLRFYTRFYKYPFPEALLIYEQAPNATACGEVKHWNKVGRRVHKGTKGIPVINETDRDMELRYVFDISDTYGEDRGIPRRWTLPEQYIGAVVAELESRSRVPPPTDDQSKNLKWAVEEYVRESCADYVDSLRQNIADSFLEELDDDSLRKWFTDTVVDSVGYLVSARLGLTQGLYDDDELSFEMLCVTSDGRNAALDMRCIDPSLPDFESSKVNACVRNILEIYKETEKDKSAQMIFCDISTPKGAFDIPTAEGVDGVLAVDREALKNRPFTNVYDDIRAKLILAGVKLSEVTFIHDAKTDEQKEKMFAAVRRGDMRAILGSTQKMGAGTNAQKRLIALHHLDCPYRPSDLEQREGRIVRQGNDNPEVRIFQYVTKNSFVLL